MQHLKLVEVETPVGQTQMPVPHVVRHKHNE
jgi:hypothetical protein